MQLAFAGPKSGLPEAPPAFPDQLVFVNRHNELFLAAQLLIANVARGKGIAIFAVVVEQIAQETGVPLMQILINCDLWPAISATVSANLRLPSAW